MTIQHFGTAPSAIAFPQMISPATNVIVATAQLRKLFWAAPAQKLVGVFLTRAADYDYQLAPAVFFGVRMGYLWRDGSSLDLLSTTPITGFNGSTTLEITATTAGDVLRRNFNDDVAKDEIVSAAGDALFPISKRWAMDITPVCAISAGIRSNPYEGSYTVGLSAAFAVVASTANGNFQIVSMPSSVVVYSANSGTSSTWAHPRDLVYIDARQTAMTFMQDSGGTVNASAAALVRLFKTTTTPWTLLWTDTLPATDSVMAYDPTNEIVYSCGKFASNATIHASKLKQSPVSLSTVTLVSGTTLQEMQATGLSVVVKDGQGSGMSGVLVCWTLSASVSGGSLLSAYSRSNVSGVATMTYIGTRLSGGTTTEFVSAAVATIDPITRG